jgi:hypothetical protein
MAIGNRQIGWSQEENLLWEVSRQLDRMNSILCPCPITTTTTTTSSVTNYNVAGCERMEYHVISYTGNDVLPEGTIVNNATPECWFIVDQTTDPADVGTVEYIWPILNECAPCVDSYTTTTTTTIPLVNAPELFQQCNQPCGSTCGPFLFYYNVFMTQECIDTFPTIGCAIWDNEEGTDPFPDGTYNLGNGDCIVITGGIITDILTY